jgi:Zn finger protein HypA/HybF involved in hydrogenase expression
MGERFRAKCLDCGDTFTMNQGGGFFFHLLGCEKCGRTKTIGFEELGEVHDRYLKGLPCPYCRASSEHDRYVREHVDVEPMSEDEYHREVEKIVGKCKCGGQYVFDAPSRCPKCRSTNFKRSGNVVMMYD